MNVRVQSLLCGAKWIQEQRGNEALARVLARCSAPLRERYTSALPIEWHPQEELVEFISVAEALLGDQSGQLSAQIGAATARCNLQGFVKRTVFYFANREYLFRRVAALWRQFNDAGELKVLEFDRRTGQMELLGMARPNRYFCALITGWSLEVSLALGVKHPQSKHTSCLAEGGDRCLWNLVWRGYSFDERELEKSKLHWTSNAPDSSERPRR